MRRTMLLLFAALAGCQAGGGGNVTPAANDTSGDNVMTTADAGQNYDRDLPAARAVRGDWTVKKVGWFAVSGNETVPRAAWREAAFTGAHIRIDQQKIHVALKGESTLGFFQIDCAGIGYLGKDAMVENGRLSRPSITREDLLRDHGIAVAEKELVQAYPGMVSTDAQMLPVICQESPNDERTTGWMTGVLLMQRDVLVITYSNGVTLFATRDKP